MSCIEHGNIIIYGIPLTRTNASKSSRRVDTRASILTRVLVQTLVNVNGAELAREAAALADGPRRALLAHAVVLTRIGITILAVVTPLATQLWRTLAVKVILEIDALGAVETRLACARVQVIFAPGPREARRTRA